MTLTHERFPAVDAFVDDRLGAMRERPRMWATSKESFGFLVVQLVELSMLHLHEDAARALLIALRKRIFGEDQPGVHVPLNDATEDWCIQTVDTAMMVLRELRDLP